MNKISFILFNIYDWVMNRLEKIGKISIFLLIFFVSQFLFVGNVKAVETVGASFTGLGNYMGPMSWLSSPFIAEQSNITAFEFSSANSWSTGKRWEVFICQGDINITANTATDGCGGMPLVVKATTTTTAGAGIKKIYFATTTLYSGVKYFYTIHVFKADGQFTANGQSTSTNINTYYEPASDDNYKNLVNTYSIQPYFKTYYDNSITGLNDLEIVLDTPANNSQVGISSPFFSGKFRDDNHLATDIVLTIHNEDFNLDTVKSFSLASTTYNKRTKTFGAILIHDVGTPMNYGTLGTSTWTAYLTNATTVVGQANYANTFYIGTSTLIVEFNKENTCYKDDLSTLTGQFTCGLKLAFAWVIQPSQSSIDSVQTSWTAFKGSFPFNVYFQLTDTISSTISSTTLSNSGGIGIPMINANRDIYIEEFISSSSLSNAVGHDNADLIRDTISWLIWLVLGILLFFEIKKI